MSRRALHASRPFGLRSLSRFVRCRDSSEPLALPLEDDMNGRRGRAFVSLSRSQFSQARISAIPSFAIDQGHRLCHHEPPQPGEDAAD